ncbi:MAG TPA: pitrilysin family protein [Saprospiraceae bacterium]|nr:pitrilysin family protein [Saprospiraceae bacterium]
MAIEDLKIPRIQTDWSRLQLAPYDFRTLSNGAQLYQIQSNKPGLCSLEIVFRNGRWGERKKLAARMTANLIQDGNLQYSTDQVADTIDFYGANLSIHADLDFTVISMSCLQKHFDFLMSFLAELLIEPAFREADLVKSKVFMNSQLQHQLSEPDYVSYREFTSLIYGRDSVYGYNTSPELIEAIQREDLVTYQRENYVAGLMSVFYCGELGPAADQLFERVLNPFPTGASGPVKLSNNPVPPTETRHFPIEHCAQFSLKMGLRCFPKVHPDFYGLYVLNAILGDYFGSRLMKSLREDKGYTYDIHSTLDAQVYDGCFYISAELNPDKSEDAIRLIQHEMDILRTRLVPEKELEMVRNYLCGNIMRLLDGPFQTMVFLKILVMEYGGPKAFHQLLTEIVEVRPERLRELAIQYLDPEKMTRVTAGA